MNEASVHDLLARLGIHLQSVDSVPIGDSTVLVATVNGIRTLFSGEIGEIEALLRKRHAEVVAFAEDEDGAFLVLT